jgi:hypothetical protein
MRQELVVQQLSAQRLMAAQVVKPLPEAVMEPTQQVVVAVAEVVDPVGPVVHLLLCQAMLVPLAVVVVALVLRGLLA